MTRADSLVAPRPTSVHRPDPSSVADRDGSQPRTSTSSRHLRVLQMPAVVIRGIRRDLPDAELHRRERTDDAICGGGAVTRDRVVPTRLEGAGAEAVGAKAPVVCKHTVRVTRHALSAPAVAMVSQVLGAWQPPPPGTQAVGSVPERAETKTRLASARAGEAAARERTQTQRPANLRREFMEILLRRDLRRRCRDFTRRRSRGGCRKRLVACRRTRSRVRGWRPDAARGEWIGCSRAG